MTPLTFAFDMDDTANFDGDMHRFTKFFIKNCGDAKKYASNEQSTVKRANASALFTYEFKKRSKVLHIMPNATSDKKISQYVKPKACKTYYNGTNLWLLKPTGMNRGRGIELFTTLEELNKYINQYLEGDKSAVKKKVAKPEDESDSNAESDEEAKNQAKKGPPGANFRSHTFVIQKYIESPLLINQRKFDIRVYAMVTHEMQLYYFE